MTNEPGKILGAKAAVVICSLMLAGFAVLSVVTAQERANRAELETFSNPSAVGEPVVFTLPETDWEGTFIVKRDGIDLFAKRKRGSRDAEMSKAGTDDSGKIPLFRRWKKDRLQEDFFVKLAPGIFLELSKTGKNPDAAPPQSVDE